MTVEVTVPELGYGANEAKVVVWHARAGDTVKAGDVIAEVMTEKVNIEVESPVNGVLAEIRVPEEELMGVGGVLATIEEHP